MRLPAKWSAARNDAASAGKSSPRGLSANNNSEARTVFPPASTSENTSPPPGVVTPDCLSVTPSGRNRPAFTCHSMANAAFSSRILPSWFDTVAVVLPGGGPGYSTAGRPLPKESTMPQLPDHPDKLGETS